MTHDSARKAEKLGYTHIRAYAAGFPNWKKTGHYSCVAAEWLKKALAKKDKIKVVDVRTAHTFNRGHIPTAINVPAGKFDSFKNELLKDKTSPLLFYCGDYDCALSHHIAKKMLRLGYPSQKVKVLSGGMAAWYKVLADQAPKTAAKAAPEAAVAGALKAGKEEGSVDIATFEKIIKEKPDSILLIDVRDKHEYVEGHFKTAQNIPSDDLEKKIATLPTDKPIVFVCLTGARSGEAYYMVLDSRPKMKPLVYYLEAEITFNKDGSYKIKPNE